MAKPGERIDAVEEIAFPGFYEVQYGIKKIGQDVGAERMSLLAQAEKENAAKKTSSRKAVNTPANRALAQRDNDSSRVKRKNGVKISPAVISATRSAVEPIARSQPVSKFRQPRARPTVSSAFMCARKM